MGDFSAMTANLRFGKASDGANGWEFRKNAVAGMMQALGPDFIAVQEANDFQADFLESRLPGYGLVGWRKDGPDYWQNNIIFFKKSWRLLDWKHFYLSQTPETPSKWEDSKWPRQCTMARFSKQGQTLAVVDTHFDFLEEVQVRSARLILEMLRGFAPKEPVVLMGDFNAFPGAGAWKAFLEQGGFSDPFDKRFGGTHHGFSGKSMPGRIDWILHRGALTPLKHSRRIIRDKFGGRYPSDHFPVYCAFEWA